LPCELRPPLLLVTMHVTGGTAVVSVRGDLDVTTRAQLAEVLAQALATRPRRVVFDMAHADYLDCFSVRAIFAAARSLPDRRPVIAPARASAAGDHWAGRTVHSGGKPRARSCQRG
jgi:anti-anti-sigma factor